MQVKIENIKISPVIKILYDIPLKGKQSRHRTKFIKLLDGRLKEVGEEESEILKEHCHLDDDGNPKKTDKGTQWDVKNIEYFANDRNELYREEFVIDGGNNQEILNTVKDILGNLARDFSGQDATIYNELCDAFGVDEDEKDS